MFSVFTNTDHILLLVDTHNKKWTKMITFLIAYLWECYQLFFRNKIDLLAFRRLVYIQIDFIFCHIYTRLSKQSKHSFRRHIHILKNFKNVFFSSVRSDIWKGCCLISRDYLHIRYNYIVNFPLACSFQV